MAFCMGLLTIFASAMHLHIIKVSPSSDDVTWETAPRLHWLVVELSLLTICATLPSLPTLLRLIAPSMFGESHVALSPIIGPDSPSWNPFSGLRNKPDRLAQDQYDRFLDTEYALSNFSQLELYSERSKSCGTISITVKECSKGDNVTDPFEKGVAASRDLIQESLRLAYK
ncbi:hypothetical protein F5Y15DRAFT_417114 [Xylariaceae sp. FL0016]|nr:hypothetical protein F5Y15DRAFT_417114 [Xylariaceae sp. FL0016]